MGREGAHRGGWQRPSCRASLSPPSPCPRLEPEEACNPPKPALRTSSSSGHFLTEAFHPQPSSPCQLRSHLAQGPTGPPQTPGVTQTFLEDSDPVPGGNSLCRQSPLPFCRQDVEVIKKDCLLGWAPRRVSQPGALLNTWCLG